MTKIEFKKRWESDGDGGGITFDDIADCAKEWGICGVPRIVEINEITHLVLKAANTNDAEDYAPQKLEGNGLTLY